MAALAAWPFSKALGDGLVTVLFKTGLDFVFEPAGILAWLCVCALSGAAASFLPAWHASRCPVQEAVSYE